MKKSDEKCPHCGYPLPIHHSLCPDNWINYDSTQYRACQMDGDEDCWDEETVMSPNGLNIRRKSK